MPNDIFTPARTALVKLRRCASPNRGRAAESRRVCPGRLDTFLVVDVHVEIGAVLLGERNAFVIDQRGVLDGGDACADRILDTFRRMCVRLDTQAEIGGFFHAARFPRG